MNHFLHHFLLIIDKAFVKLSSIEVMSYRCALVDFALKNSKKYVKIGLMSWKILSRECGY